MIEETPASPSQSTEKISKRSRFYGAFWGMHIGDSLGIATHGYYNREQLRRDYGRITHYVKPQLVHPESILYKIPADRFHPAADVRGAKAPMWGRRETHYHHGLEAGDNSLSVLMAREMFETLAINHGFDADRFRRRAEELLLTPGRHNDLLVPDPWRVYCVGKGQGKPPAERAGLSESLAGMVWVLPVILYYIGRPEIREKVSEAVAVTQISPVMESVAMLLVDVFEALFAGVSLANAVQAEVDRGHPLLGKPIVQWATEKISDEKIASYELRCASISAHALPMSLFLSMKYAPAVESALLANANLGGATCYRGAVVGALMGAALGCESLPGELASQLRDFSKCDTLCDAAWASASAANR